MRTFLAVVAGIAMAICIVAVLGALSEIGTNPSAGFEAGVAFALFVLASILLMLTEISATLAKILSTSQPSAPPQRQQPTEISAPGAEFKMGKPLKFVLITFLVLLTLVIIAMAILRAHHPPLSHF